MATAIDRGSHRGRVRSPRTVGVRRRPVYVMLTDEERAVLETNARLRGVSLSRAARDAIIKPLKVNDESAREDLEKLSAALAPIASDLTGIARNFNQITRYAHTIRDFPPEYRQAVALVNAILFRIRDALNEVER